MTGGSDASARLWDPATGLPLGVSFWHHDAVQTVAFHPTEPLLATGSRDRTARVWHGLPAPLEGSAAEVRQWAESFTGLRLTASDSFERLAPSRIP